MTEDDARAWLDGNFGGPAVERLSKFKTALEEASATQNLISRSTLSAIWSRHFVDSAQLIRLASPTGLWVDVGSGAGLPGLVVACCTDRPMMLVEPRRLRVEFLRNMIEGLGLSNVQIVPTKSEKLSLAPSAATISARAVASLGTLFAACATFSDRGTRWVLPKGISAEGELAIERKRWRGAFHVEQSILDERHGIVVADAVERI